MTFRRDGRVLTVTLNLPDTLNTLNTVNAKLHAELAQVSPISMTIPASEAARMGLINRAVPADQLDEDVYALAHRLASAARNAIRWTKVTTNIALKQLAHSIMDTGAAYESMSNVSQDHREAVAAFREKRKPVFTGG
ncbi:MAG: enoyl-CoA hydratase-related protein [Rhodobacterales bacterium]